MAVRLSLSNPVLQYRYIYNHDTLSCFIVGGGDLLVEAVELCEDENGIVDEACSTVHHLPIKYGIKAKLVNTATKQ